MSDTTQTFAAGVRELATLLLSRRARRAIRGLIMLRRVYEHVLVTTTVEGARPLRTPDYEGCVDALTILAASAELISRTL